MSLRRPRIKPVINLSTTRKAKPKVTPALSTEVNVASADAKADAPTATTTSTREENVTTLNGENAEESTKQAEPVTVAVKTENVPQMVEVKVEKVNKLKVVPLASPSVKSNEIIAEAPTTIDARQTSKGFTPPRSSPKRKIAFATPPPAKVNKVEILSVQTVNVVPPEAISKLRAQKSTADALSILTDDDLLFPIAKEIVREKKPDIITIQKPNDFLPVIKTETPATIPAFGETLKTKSVSTIATFKRPAKIEPFNLNTIYNADANQRDVIQMDLQKATPPPSPSASPSAMAAHSLPVKHARPRIRPMPMIIGQRRNSLIATSPSPHTGGSGTDDVGEMPITPTRRERHYSGSQTTSTHNHYHHLHKFTPTLGTGRVRTESNCSAYSDSNTISAHKSSRKIDDQTQQRLNSRREREERFKNGINKAELKMSDMIYYNPPGKPIKVEKSSDNEKISMESKPILDKKVKEEKVIEEKVTEEDSKSNIIGVPQLKLNEMGEMIIDDQSLTIETTADREARLVLASSSVVFHDELKTTSMYKRRKRTRDWTQEETLKFYVCLQRLGTDFSLMAPLFKDRTRRDLKLKFKKEERINLVLIDKALTRPKEFDMDALMESLEIEEEKFRKRREEDEAEVMPIKRKKPKAKYKALRPIADGEFVNELLNCEKQPRLKKRKKRKNTIKEDQDQEQEHEPYADLEPVEKPVEKWDGVGVGVEEEESLLENNEPTALDIVLAIRESKESLTATELELLSKTTKTTTKTKTKRAPKNRQPSTEQMNEDAVFEQEMNDLLKSNLPSNTGATPLANYFGHLVPKSVTSTPKVTVNTALKVEKAIAAAAPTTVSTTVSTTVPTTVPTAVASEIITTDTATFSVTVLDCADFAIPVTEYNPPNQQTIDTATNFEDHTAVEKSSQPKRKPVKPKKKSSTQVKKLQEIEPTAETEVIIPAQEESDKSVNFYSTQFSDITVDLSDENLSKESLDKIREVFKASEEEEYRLAQLSNANVKTEQAISIMENNNIERQNIAQDDVNSDIDDIDEFLEQIGVTPETYNETIEHELRENFGNTVYCEMVIAKIHARLDAMRKLNEPEEGLSKEVHEYSLCPARYPLNAQSNHVDTTIGTLFVTDGDDMNPALLFAGKTDEQIFELLSDYEFLITENPEESDIYYELFMVDSRRRCVSQWPLNFLQEDIKNFINAGTHVRLLKSWQSRHCLP